VLVRRESVFPFDIGRESAKFPGQLIIPFRVSDWQEDFDDSGDFTTVVNGVRWCVGERAKYGNYARQQVTANKANTETMVMLLTGAYLRAPEQSNLFVTAIPIKQWTKDVFNPYKVALRKQLLGEYEVSVNNGKPRTIAIDNLDITFEGAGIWFYYVLDDSGNDNPKYSWLRSKKVHVVDLGSRTANYLGIYQEHFTKRDSDTSDNGTLQIRRAKKGKQMTERDIEQHARAIIADISALWLEADFNSAVDRDDIPESDDVLILAGGGTALCQKYLKAAFPNALIPPDPVTAQLIGLGRLGQKRNAESSTA
jgi:hypothetical protein